MLRRWAWLIVLLLVSCLFDPSVQPISSPDELHYNYWLLQRLSLYAEKLVTPDSSEASGDSLLDAGAYVPANLDGIDSLTYLSVKALFSSLGDPYTRYVPPETVAEQVQSDTSTVVQGGIGIQMVWLVSADSARLQVYRVYADGPAEAAGLKVGDRLIECNGVDLRNDSAYILFQQQLSNSQWIRLEVLRGTEPETLSIEIEQGTVYVPTVFIDTVNGVPVIQITRFVRSSIKDGGSLLELQRALDSTQGMGTRVLDLRDNPGGEVSVCEAMADEFLSAQPMIYRIYHSFDSRGQARVDTLIDSAGDGGAAEGEQVILAVDSGTASCAEIFAAALRDNQEKPALLVGTHTYGKGIGQSHWATPAGGMAVITSLQFQTLEGIAYHGTGLLPDVEASDAAMISTAVALAQTNSVVARHNIEKTFANAVPGFVLWSESLDRAVVGGAWIDGDFGL